MCRPCQYRYSCSCRGQPSEAGTQRCIHYGRLNRMRAAGLRENEYMYRVEHQLCRNDSEPTWVPVERKCGICMAADAKAERLKRERFQWDKVRYRVIKASKALQGMIHLVRIRKMEWEDPGGVAKQRSARKMAFSGPSAQEPGYRFTKIRAHWIELVSTKMIIDRYGGCSGLTEKDVQKVLLETNGYLVSRPDFVQWIHRA